MEPQPGVKRIVLPNRQSRYSLKYEVGPAEGYPRQQLSLAHDDRIANPLIDADVLSSNRANADSSSRFGPDAGPDLAGRSLVKKVSERPTEDIGEGKGNHPVADARPSLNVLGHGIRSGSPLFPSWHMRRIPKRYMLLLYSHNLPGEGR